MIWLAAVLLLYLFQIVTIVLLEFRNPAKAVAWLMVLFIFPLVGIVMYYFLAKRYTNRRKVKKRVGGMTVRARRLKRKQMRERRHGEQGRLMSLLLHLPGSPITHGNKTTVLTDAPDTYAAILGTMEAARDHIHLDYYTIRHDGIGMRFQETMIRKAGQGVAVRLLYDGIGSYELSDRYVRALTRAGVEVRCFLPPFIALFDKRLNYRNHRKVAVIDGKIGFVGGINIGDEYLGKAGKFHYWRDTHLQIEGEAVHDLQRTFVRDWHIVTGHKLTESRYYPETGRPGEEQVQIVTSGPDAEEDAILEMYFMAMATAKRRIYITTPYFVPEASIAMALKTAAASGVDVRIILPSVADTVIVYWAAMSFLEDLMTAGVRFYMYQKGFIHAKVLLVDDAVASVGTANLDMRSFYSNFELNAMLFDAAAIKRLERDFMRDLQSCREVDPDEFDKRPRSERVKEALARLLSPLF